MAMAVTMASLCYGSVSLSSSFKGSNAFARSSSLFSVWRSSMSSKKSSCSIRTKAVTGRFRLHNLSPQKGATRKRKRKGRGPSAGQGGSCGFGMRGQKSRSGSRIRAGFQGGQMPLYRRIPKLKGIAGGMKASRPKFIPVNLSDIAWGYKEGEQVTLETLKAKRLINPSGFERRLPLKILGDGEVNVKLSIEARAFSKTAKEKLENAGCTLTTLPGRKKWLPAQVTKKIRRAEEYFSKKKGLPWPRPPRTFDRSSKPSRSLPTVSE